MKPLLYVLCSSADAHKAWTRRAPFHTDLEVLPQYPVKSAMQRIQELAGEQERPFLVCRDSVWVGLGMGRQVELLIAELEGRYPNWGACGNRGVRWDGQILDFGRTVRVLGLRTSVVAHVVLSLDDNLLLLNPEQLRGHTRRAPAISSLHSGTLLSLQCLANGSVMGASPRLLTIRTEEEDDSLTELMEDAEFQSWYRSHFLNHAFPGPSGMLDLSRTVDFGYVTDAVTQAKQADVLELHDQALAAASRRPSLTLCCRTQFDRPEMLDRAVLSFSVCRDHAALLGDFQIRLVTDRPEAAAEPALSSLQKAYPSARLECWFQTVREKRLSRIDLLLAAVERAETDYIWFVDDDDYVNPASLAAAARCLIPDSNVVLITSSPVVTEEWKEAPETGAGSSAARPEQRRKLMRAEHSRSYPARHIFGVLRGDNQIPICGMILPVKLLRERVRHRTALGEYCEDYFLLLLALTAPRVEVSVLEIDLATVSARGQENTTAQMDRSVWHQSSATFLLETLNNEEGNSPFLWQQGNVPPWDWMDF